VVDTKKEQIAVNEARKLNIPIFAVVDTNADPTIIDFPIPSNDDAAKSISVISRTFADAVMEGRQKLTEKKAEQEAEQEKKAKLEEETDTKEEKARKTGDKDA
jgi:small subunit ribosomal protein S2